MNKIKQIKNYSIFLAIVLAGMLSVIGCKETPKSNATVDNAETLQKDYTEIGLKYATSTQAELGKNLMAAIQKEGTLGALKFCNLQAYPLTDSMAVVHKAKLKRVSDKPRNPNNLANKKELKHIDYFKKMIASGEEYQPIVEKENSKVNFYFPIIANEMCLQCHGKPNLQIEATTMKALKELYPKDMATGYSAKELRGIWSVAFNE